VLHQSSLLLSFHADLFQLLTSCLLTVSFIVGNDVIVCVAWFSTPALTHPPNFCHGVPYVGPAGEHTALPESLALYKGRGEKKWKWGEEMKRGNEGERCLAARADRSTLRRRSTNSFSRGGWMTRKGASSGKGKERKGRVFI